MEEKDFDKRISDHFRDIFEEYQDPSSEEGWDLLRQKYPQNTDRKLLFRWFLAAAALLLVFSWILWPANHAKTNSKLFRKGNHQQTKTSASVQNQTDQTQTLKKTSKSVQNQTDQLQTQTSKVSLSVQNQSNQDEIQTSKTASANVQDPIEHHQVSEKEAVIIPSESSKKLIQQETAVKDIQHTIKQKPVPAEQVQATKPSDVFAAAPDKPVNSSADENQQDNNLINANFIPLKEAQQISLKPVSGMNPLQSKLPEIKIQVKAATVFPPVSAKNKPSTALKNSFAVYTDTHFNFASGSSHQFGYGAGLLKDFQLYKKLKLTAGLALIQQNLFYTSNFPVNQISSSFNVQNSLNNSVTGGSSSSTVNSVKAGLLALDVPVNLQYQLLGGKNSVYISAGLSSDFYVRETYTYDYTNTQSNLSAGQSLYVSTPQTTVYSKNFSHFDFARTLNLSFGVARQLNKNQLQLEPFLKLPLGGLATNNLRFGSAGISLKFYFQTSKKK